MNIKKLSAIAAGLVATAALAGAQGGISVIVDGTPVAFHGVGPQQVNGRVLVPLRGVLEQMGAYVDWDSAGQLVTAQRGDTTIELRIGQRSAQVNNQPMTLDVPAEIFHGSTMVPLRFMSEALGADVRWDPAQYAVVITSGSSTGISTQPITPPPDYGTPLPVTPPPVTRVHIQSFYTNRQGRLAPGDVVQFTMNGTPGGDATLTIPGMDGEIPMNEVSEGVYQASWTVPNSQSGFNLTRITPVAHLRIGGSESSFQMTARVGTGGNDQGGNGQGGHGRRDNAPPLINSITPLDQATVTMARPTISASFDDTIGSGVDPQSIQMTVDGVDVSSDLSITSNVVRYRPAVGYGPGRHNVVLKARDVDGNLVTKTWMFRVGQQSSDVIQSFNAPDVTRARPGDSLRFVLIAQPSGQAHFSIGDVLHRKPMQEVAPGRYIGTYIVRQGDDLSDQEITAEFIARNGAVYNINSTDRPDLAGGSLAQPTIEIPNSDEVAQNPLIVQGMAEPGARVHVKVTYLTSLAGLANLTGTVSDVTVVADDRGHYRTNPVSIDSFTRGRRTQFTIAATTLGPNGQQSDPVSITTH
jgi:hypothetical protein